MGAAVGAVIGAAEHSKGRVYTPSSGCGIVTVADAAMGFSNLSVAKTSRSLVSCRASMQLRYCISVVAHMHVRGIEPKAPRVIMKLLKSSAASTPLKILSGVS